MEKQYIEKRDDVYWIAGTRVSLDSVIHAFRDGLSPETIAAECFPTLTLEQVYGAITYYLRNKQQIDNYLNKADSEFESLRYTVNEPAFSKKMAEVRRSIHKSDS